MSDCLDCGRCHWQDCDNDADYKITHVTVKRRGTHIFVGDVLLCGGHYTWTEHTGRLNIDWALVERALGNLDETRTG